MSCAATGLTSWAVLNGFVVGVAMTIALGQLGKIFGAHAEGDGFFEEAWELIRHLNELHVETHIVGVASCHGESMISSADSTTTSVTWLGWATCRIDVAWMLVG